MNDTPLDFIGRQDVITELYELVLSLVQGSVSRSANNTLAFVGGPGIGKTRLSLELRDGLIQYAKEKNSEITKYLESSLYLFTTFVNGCSITQEDRNSNTAVGMMGLRALHSFFAPQMTLPDFRNLFEKHFGKFSGDTMLLNLAFQAILTTVGQNWTKEKKLSDRLVIFFAIDEFNVQVDPNLEVQELMSDQGYLSFRETINALKCVSNTNLEYQGVSLRLIPIYSGISFRPIMETFSPSVQGATNVRSLELLSSKNSLDLCTRFLNNQKIEIKEDYLYSTLSAGGHPRSLQYLFRDIQKYRHDNFQDRNIHVKTELLSYYPGLPSLELGELFGKALLRHKKDLRLWKDDPIVLQGIQYGLCTLVDKRLEIPGLLASVALLPTFSEIPPKDQPILCRAANFFLKEKISDDRTFEIAGTLAEACRLRAFETEKTDFISLENFMGGSKFELSEFYKTIEVSFLFYFFALLCLVQGNEEHFNT